MNNYTDPVKKCPEHEGEQLETINLSINLRNSEWIGYPLFNYCPQSNKYLSKGKLVSIEEVALNHINTTRKRRNLLARIFMGKFKLNEIKVKTEEEHFKNLNLN